MALVRADNVFKSYFVGRVEVPALRGLTFQIEKGEFTVIAGPSGSGKTTLLNLFGCLDKPTKGRIFIEGKDVFNFSQNELADIRNKHIGFIFQTFNLIPVLTAFENVEFPLIIYGIKSFAERKKRVYNILKELDILELANRKPPEMSGGQQQRVAIARALVKNPDYVLADEPTANLDTKTGEEILQLMKEMNQKNRVTFIFSTHDPKIMAKARRLIKIRDGLIESDERF